MSAGRQESAPSGDVRLALIGGKEVDPGVYFDVVDPSTGRRIAQVARCGKAEIDAAVRSAQTAFDGGWKRTSPAERAELLLALARAITTDGEELARLESTDTGKPMAQARADVKFAATYFSFYGQTVQAFHGSTIPVGPETLVYTLRQPHGVTGHIVPWNYPLQVSSRTVAVSLAAGNCVVLKPAEEAPLTPLRMAALALEVGFPAGVFNVVPGLGEEAGAALSAHPGLGHISFTGSVEVGRLVAQSAGRNIVPVTMELGGKSPNIVFADANLDAAIPVICKSIIQNAGQTCSAGSRLLVQQSVHEEVVERIAAQFQGITIGAGVDNPDLGPLISAVQRDRVESLVAKGRDQSQLVQGGGAPADEALAGGFYYSPTLFDNVDPQSVLAQEEVFGPVVAVTPFAGLDNALELANSTRFGLMAAIWTRDIGRAHWLAQNMESGQVFINSYGAGGGVAMPFGGVKESGFGREKGFEALLAYTRTKSIAVSLSDLGPIA